MPSSSGCPPVLDNPRSDRVRRVAGLSGRSARSRASAVLVEGPQAVRELLAHRPASVRDVYISAAARLAHPGIAGAALSATRWVHTVTDEVAAALSADCQGVCAVASADAIVREWPADGGFYVIIAQGRDPGNVGTIIRTADAMGARAVLTVAGTADVTSPKVVRASAGSVFHLPVIPHPAFGAAVDALHARGARVLGTSGGPRAVPLPAVEEEGALAGPHAWALGNEARGLDADEVAACDLLVAIPMTGLAESLNVASAAAVCLYASQRARGAGRPDGAVDGRGGARAGTVVRWHD